MPKSTAAVEAPITVTRETLDETPARALKLLRGLGTRPAIRGALAKRGYSDADHAEGWSLLHAASGYVAGGPTTTVDADVEAAIHAVDAWEHSELPVIRATLARHAPAIGDALLAGTHVESGVGALVVVETVLDRLDALEKSKHKEDHAALAVLAKRGIDKAARHQIRAALDKAKTGASATPSADDTATTAADGKHVAALAKLRSWYEEWAGIAHSAITRRDHLILLGLAKRKAPAKKPPAAPAKPATP
jgi:hypothetical protein